MVSSGNDKGCISNIQFYYCYVDLHACPNADVNDKQAIKSKMKVDFCLQRTATVYQNFNRGCKIRIWGTCG